MGDPPSFKCSLFQEPLQRRDGTKDPFSTGRRHSIGFRYDPCGEEGQRSRSPVAYAGLRWHTFGQRSRRRLAETCYTRAALLAVAQGQGTALVALTLTPPPASPSPSSFSLRISSPIPRDAGDLSSG